MNTKTPLLLIPGLLCDEALWASQIQHLSDIADIVVADTTQDTSIEDMAARAHLQMQTRFPDKKYALAGLSMGGYIALALYRRQADYINKLALIDTRASGESAHARQARERLVSMVKAHERFVGMSPQELPRYIHPDRLTDRALTDIIREMTLRVGKDTYLRQQEAIISRADAMDVLPMITCETLIICGEQDAITPPEHSQLMSQFVPHAQLKIIPNCGHLSTLEAPELINATMRAWLA